MDPVLAALERAAENGLMPRGATVLLAVSGGADSLALLFGCVEGSRRTGWRLAVGHVHHGWRRREADRDLSFVADHARRLGLPFFHRRCDAGRAAAELGLSPEAGARHVRYEALGELAKEAGASRIATAHQRDDAVESYLLALERRGGLSRRAGPRARREDGVVRPLLAVGRGAILAFLAERGLRFRRDATNGDLALSRNRVRRRLAGVNDADRAALAEEVSALARERERLDDEFARRVAPAIRREDDAASVDARILADCSDELLRLVLSRLAGPLARAGRPPMTGRERERIVARLRSGEDFRFEAGRRICFERRRGRLRIRLRSSKGAGPVYDSAQRIPV
jgi:tRNA(Ile)-lysidine synthase